MAGKGGEGVRGVLNSRWDVIELLSERSRRQAEIASALDISRSTVTRAMDQLQEHGLAVRAGSEYELTRLGETLRQTHHRYRAEVSAVLEVEPLIDHIPTSAPFDPSVLVDATWYDVESGASYQIRDRVTDAIREAVAIKEMGRTRSEQKSAEVHLTKVLEERRPVESVLSEDLFFHIRDIERGSKMLEADNMDVSIHGSVPYGLFILEQPADRVLVMVIYDEGDTMKGIIRTDATKAVAWAESVFDSFQAEAIPMAEYTQ